MAHYSIETKPSFDRAFDRLPGEVQRRVTACIELLADTPRPFGCKKLTGEALYRARVGSYRIVYEIRDAVLLIVVVKVGHRREVYR